MPITKIKANKPIPAPLIVEINMETTISNIFKNPINSVSHGYETCLFRIDKNINLNPDYNARILGLFIGIQNSQLSQVLNIKSDGIKPLIDKFNENGTSIKIYLNSQGKLVTK